jgi:hypothetical protein
MSNGGTFQILNGCVSDILRVEEFLRNRLRVPPYQILKLTATNASSGSPLEPFDSWPTYQNIISALRELTESANPGDEVYIHYSGHGVRVCTVYPELKGQDGLDEALVPVDIGASEARYLRDIEMQALLKGMVDRGLLVTLVLDTCHSGWTFQGGTGCVVLAACTPQQAAFEYRFGGEINGALTHFLLEALAETGTGMTYETLYNRLRAKVRTEFPRQTPMIIGESQRPVLGLGGMTAGTREYGQPLRPQGVLVFSVAENGHLRLNTGQAQGVLDGARFAVYTPDADLTNPGEPLAEVEIMQYGGTESLAEVKEAPPPQSIPPGSRAVLRDPGPKYRRTTVGLAYRSSSPNGLEEVLEAVAAGLAGTSYLRLAEEGKPADFLVAVTERHEIEIQDSTGRPVPNLRPPLPAQAPEGASATVERLVHLAEYRAVRQLETTKAPSDLAGQLVVELFGLQDNYDPSKRPDPRPGAGGVSIQVQVGQWTLLRISNCSSHVLNVEVLNLQSDWAITRIHPGVGDANLCTLDYGRSFDLPLQAQLPPGVDEGMNVMKVFATLGPADFRFLELPPLDQPKIFGGAQRTMTLPPRHPDWLGSPHKEWTSAQVTVRIRRSGS